MTIDYIKMKKMLENTHNLEGVLDQLEGEYPDTYESWNSLREKYVSTGFDHLHANKLATRGMEYLHNYAPPKPNNLTFEWAEANNVFMTDTCNVSITELLLIGLVQYANVSLAEGAQILEGFRSALSQAQNHDALYDRFGGNAIITSNGRIRESADPETMNAMWASLVNYIETGTIEYGYRQDSKIGYEPISS
jgi:hypothetical protein